MNALTQEWIDKAEGDYLMARREMGANRSPNYDGICFHAQQAAEKYFKARLHAAAIPFGKIHDLSVLLDLVLPVEPEWELLRPAAETLTDYAVRFRYPGASATRLQARQALELCRLIRKAARPSFRLKIPTSRQRSSATRKRAAGKARRKGGKG